MNDQDPKSKGILRWLGLGGSSQEEEPQADDGADAEPKPAEPECPLRPVDPDRDPVGGGQAHALGEHVEALLDPVAVEGDGHRGPRATAYSESAAEGVESLCVMTSRPA